LDLGRDLACEADEEVRASLIYGLLRDDDRTVWPQFYVEGTVPEPSRELVLVVAVHARDPCVDGQRLEHGVGVLFAVVAKAGARAAARLSRSKALTMNPKSR
jgi:hypothetical protein